jgi:hypothetical protein
MEIVNACTRDPGNFISVETSNSHFLFFPLVGREGFRNFDVSPTTPREERKIYKGQCY